MSLDRIAHLEWLSKVVYVTTSSGPGLIFAGLERCKQRYLERLRRMKLDLGINLERFALLKCLSIAIKYKPKPLVS
jgi:hypothetical protein